MFEQDYVMRQIQLLTESISKLVFKKRIIAVEMFDEEGNIQGSGMLYHRLKALVSEGRINEAENLLFDELMQSPMPEYFEVAIQFYSDLTALGDEALERAEFSICEVEQGLSEIRTLMQGMYFYSQEQA